MSINATLFGQMITFAVFIWFTMKFVWPHLTKAMEQRRQKIADGLADAEKARNTLELADIKAKEIQGDAKNQAAHIIEQANTRANHIIEDAKNKAREEGERMLALAKTEVSQEYSIAREALLKEVAGFAVLGAEKVLQANVDLASNEKMIDDMLREVNQ